MTEEAHNQRNAQDEEARADRAERKAGIDAQMRVELADLRGKVEMLKVAGEERDERYAQRFDLQEQARIDTLKASEKFYDAAFAASNKAVEKAEAAQKEYNSRSNEFRAALDDSSKDKIGRAEFNSVIGAMSEKIDANKQESASGRDVIKDRVDRVEKDARIALEKIDMDTRAQIQGLRESRSVLEGEGTQGRNQRTQANWLIGVAIGVTLGVIGIIEFIINQLGK